jgi:hypothetical protein
MSRAITVYPLLFSSRPLRKKARLAREFIFVLSKIPDIASCSVA